MSDSGAHFSPNMIYRYLLWRRVAGSGPLFVYIGVNASTAGALAEDQTTKKWRRFTVDNGGGAYLAINPFAFCATDVGDLALVDDPVGPDNDRWIAEALDRASLVVPCWGNVSKVPARLRYRFDHVKDLVRNADRPIRTFGFTRSGDPKHPLMLPYSTQLVPWERLS